MSMIQQQSSVTEYISLKIHVNKGFREITLK